MRHQPEWRLIAFWVMVMLVEVGGEHVDPQSANALPTVGDEGLSALPREGVAAFEEETPAVDPAYAKLSKADREMFTSKDASSHFAGDMSNREKAFAASQGDQEAMFGLSNEDQEQALAQSRVVLDKEGQETVKYLSTPDDIISDKELGDLPNVAKAAAAHAEQLQRQLQDMQSESPQRHEQTLLQRVEDGIDVKLNDEQDENSDLGESADLSSSSSATNPKMKETITKAKEKAKSEMGAVNALQAQKVASYTQEMKEAIKKTDEKQAQKAKESQKIVSEALKEYDRKHAEAKQGKLKKIMDIREAARNMFRAAQARALSMKQDAALAYTAKSNSLTAEQSKVKMNAVTWYEKKLAMLDNKRGEEGAAAKQYLVKAKADIAAQAEKAKQKKGNDLEVLTGRFDKMRAKIDQRTKKTIADLEKTEEHTVADVKKQFATAKALNKKLLAEAKSGRTSVQKKADGLLQDSRDDAKKARDTKDQIGESELSFKKGEQDRRAQVKRDIGKIVQEKNKFDLQIARDRKEVAEKEKVREHANADKGNMSDEEYKKRQLKWLKQVEKTATKNCDDAKRESILRTRAARIANLRLVRMSKDMAFMKEKVLEDIKSKGAKAFDMKEKAQKHLKKVVAASAKAMKENPKAYDATAVQRAAVEYSKVAGPGQSQDKRIEEAAEKVKEAKKNAADHSDAWAKALNEKTSKNLKETADDVCRKEHHKFKKVKLRVKKRLGTASEADEKAVQKGDADEKKWAERKVSVMIGKGKAISEEGEKKKIQLTQQQQRDDLKAERNEKKKVNGLKEKERKLNEKATQKQSKAEKVVRDGAQAQSVRVEEAERAMQVAESAYKSQILTAHEKLEEGKRKVAEEAKRERSKLKTSRQKAANLLSQQTGGPNMQEALEMAQKKSKEMERKADSRQKELVQKITKKKEDRLKQIGKATRVGRAKAKQVEQAAKQGAEQVVAKAKVALAEREAHANHLEKEANKANPGERTEVEYDAKVKADKEMSTARDAAKEATQKAKAAFSAKVQAATDSQLKAIDKIKKKLLSDFQPPT